MARFAYDVNTRTRLIDVHKQFNGGLKTVDTDDALGAVYLRQAENVSLSEFGFIEKRYGTHEKNLIKETNGKLQGYWEYFGFAIFVIDGVFYYKDAAGTVTPVTALLQESQDPDAPSTIYGKDWRYPNVFGSLGSITEVTGCNYSLSSTVYQTTAPSLEEINAPTFTCGIGIDADDRSPYTVWNQETIEGTTMWVGRTYTASDSTRTVPAYTSNIGFPTTKDMNAVNVNDVLYIFTGKYPIYVKLVENPFGVKILRFYVFPITVPTYDEIVVTGHNLLEDDYNEVYFKNRSDIQYTNPGVSTNTYAQLTNNLDNPPFFVVQKDSDDIEIKQHAPQIAYQDGGELDFNFKYVINPDYLEEYDQGNQDRIFLLNIDSVGYRASGPGSSGYTFADPDSIDFTKLHNYTGSTDLTISLTEPLITREELNYADTSSTSYGPFASNIEIGFNQIPYSTGANGGIAFTGVGRFKLDTEANGNDFVSELNFEPGDVYEFQLREITTSATDPTPSFFAPETVLEFYNNLTTNTVTSDPTGLNDVEILLPQINIIPVDADGNRFTSDKIILTGDKLEKTSTGYKFTVPATLPNTATIVGYHISLRAQIDFYHSEASYALSNNDFPTAVTKELVKIENLEAGAVNNLGTDKNIGLKLKNLLAGTYDFRLRYKLTKYTRNASDFLEFEDVDDGVEYADVFFYNIPITAEKLQDFPGVTDDFLPKLKPIWTCNKVMEHYGKLMVWGSTEMPTAVFYSFPDRPTYFPSKFYLDFSNDTNQKIEAVTPYMNILVAQTASQTWGIRGNSGLIDAPAPYVPFGINGTVGTISYKSVRPVRNHLFFLSRQGVIALKSLYAADEQYNIDFVDRNIRNIVPQDSEAVGIQFDNQYWLNFPKNGITLRWYIDKKAWVQDKFGGYVNSDGVHITSAYGWDQMNGVFKWQIADGKLEFITHPSRLENTQNLRIYKVGVDYSLPTDLGKNVLTKLETSFLNQNYPFHHKNYKEAKLDFTLQNEYNLSRDAVYTMDTNEDVVNNSIHTMDNVSLLKNHRYRIVYNFSESTESDDVGGLSFTSEAVPDLISGGTFEETNYDIIGSLLFRILSLQDLQVTEIRIKDKDGNTTLLSSTDGGFTITELSDFDEYVDFLLPDYINGIVDIEVVGDFAGFNSGATLYDTTYDDNLSIDTWVVSEGQTLNLDNIESYDQSKARLDVDFTGRLGTWIFGSSDFGNKVTAVKTIKLSGKGYNAKVYLEDSTKSKWTLESMGITYKMKRARSR